MAEAASQLGKDKSQVDQVEKSSDIHKGDQAFFSTKYLQLRNKPWKLHPIFMGPLRVS